MPPRLSFKTKQNRPISAIYIGNQADLVSSPVATNTSTPPGLPHLPEPPSPSSSLGSTGSGLPSPPATNSTGSGSTGDPASISRRHSISIVNLNSSASSSGSNYNVSEYTGSDHAIAAMQHAPHPGVIGSVSKAPLRSSIGGRRSSSRLGNRHSESDDADDDDVFDDSNDRSFYDNDEDDTARIERRQSVNNGPNANMMALERVKSLTQRNRIALDKLSSIRLNSPSASDQTNPRSSTPLLRTSRSPFPPSSQISSPSHFSSSKLSQTQSRQSVRGPPIDKQQSGSETEREGSISHYTQTSSSSSSSHMNSLSHSINHVINLTGGRSSPPTAPAYIHQFQKSRISSTPVSPSRNRLSSAVSTVQSNHSASPKRRKKRSSGASSTSLMEYDEPADDDDGYDRVRDRDHSVAREEDTSRDITQAALAAAASSRRSPQDARRARGALPREFTEPSVAGSSTSGGRSSLDGTSRGNGVHPAQPQTPPRRERQHHQPSESIQYSPSAWYHASRSLMVRERGLADQGTTRGPSDDFTHPSSIMVDKERDRELHQHPDEPERTKRERSQSMRSGSVESALAPLGLVGGRSLIGEGLRAAGLRRRETVAGHTHGLSASVTADVFRSNDGPKTARERRSEWSRFTDSTAVDGDKSRRGTERDRGTQQERGGRTRAGAQTARATTSLGEYRYFDRDDEDDLHTAPLRTKKSAYRLSADREEIQERSPLRKEPLTSDERGREVDRSVSVFGLRRDRGTLHSDHERYPSPFGAQRSLPGTGALHSATSTTPVSNALIQHQSSEHNLLMMDSLTMFETHIARLTNLSASTQTDLVRTAQNVAITAEKLNGLIRAGNTRALEEQIDAEVNSVDDSGMECAEVWRRVGGDYREGLRCSDDLIRGITSFLLGVGKILKDHGGGGSGGSGSGAGSDAGSRGRVSIEEEIPIRSRATPDGSGTHRENRRSWEVVRDREDALRRLSARAESSLTTRPVSVLTTFREGELVGSRLRETLSPVLPLNIKNNSPAPMGAVQRAKTPRDRGGRNSEPGGIVASDSQRTLQPSDYDPSPTPMSRYGSGTSRLRPLPPLPIPKVPAAAPSERGSTAVDEADRVSSSQGHEREKAYDRRQHSINSIATVRGPPPTLSSITTTSNPTTAITTHTVSHSLPSTASPFQVLSRGASQSSGGTSKKALLPFRSTVTFSRPSTVSVSALSGLQQQDMDSRSRRPTTTGDAASVTTNESAGSGKGSGSASLSVSARSRSSMANVSQVSRLDLERENNSKRRTISSSDRASSDESRLDGGSGSGMGTGGRASVHSIKYVDTVNAADRSAASAFLSTKRERRRTVNDIWSNE